MRKIGMTLSSEEHQPAKLVGLAQEAEAKGFDFVSVSDHIHPWTTTQGHSPFAWTVLGGIAATTTTLEVGVGVTCPIIRMHPAIVAHAAATTAEMLEGRFTLGVGTGEALNEHVLGDRWPPHDVRLEMLEEAVEIIRTAMAGESFSHRGTHYTVEHLRIFDCPEVELPIVVSAFGPETATAAARIGDGLWVTGPENDEVISTFRDAGGQGPIWTQLTFCYDEDRDRAIKTARQQWPNTAIPGQLAQDLPTPRHFEQAAENVTEEMIAESVPCGPDPQPLLDGIERAYAGGATHVYLHQIGDEQRAFLQWWTDQLAGPVRDLQTES